MKSIGSRDKLQAAAAATGPRRVLLLVFASCFAFATLLTFLYTSSGFASAASSGSRLAAGSSSGAAAGSGAALPLPVFDALVHYASFSNATHRMTDTDIRAISAILRARGPCNLLVFGLGAESPLWLALNHGGRTLYDVPWDVVLIDGPSGWNPNSPGRMASVFTTAVLARSGATAAKGPTDVLVHDFNFEVEQVLSKEFLCDENRRRLLRRRPGQPGHARGENPPQVIETRTLIN
ncbi:unnamed protein product [Triticum turgidum subsp. durum]|uniref:Polysaccharide biosynthesis domain-containing protein n=1 Tax=Triticum turgidum subsp. durum TaxID=4567 RepID=A0A9R1RTH9_TRITD|nr:unnamed protein product [Triticum turgidum subsp. durum]